MSLRFYRVNAQLLNFVKIRNTITENLK